MPDNREVAIFWDYENCSPPVSSQGYTIVHGIRRIAHVFGSVTTFKAYLDMSAQTSKNSVAFRSELQSSGVSIIECPHNGRKDVVDKMILVDMLAFAIGRQPPATVILIAGDRDYAYALSTLRLRQYSVILIMPSAPNISQSLQSQASVVIDWNYAILGKRSEADTPPFRQPYRDLDDDTVRRLAREIHDANEDPAVTLMSSFHSSTTAPTHTRSTSAAELWEQSAFRRNTDTGDAVQPAPTCTPNRMVPETPGRSRGGFRPRSTTQSTQAVPDIDRDSFSPFTEINALSDGSVTDEYVSAANEIQDAPHDPFARPASMSPRLGLYQNIAEPTSPLISNFTRGLASPSLTHTSGSRTAPLPSLSSTRTISGGTPVSYRNLPQTSASSATPSSPVSTGGRSDAATAHKPKDTSSVSGVMDDTVIPSDRAAVMAAFGLDSEDEDDDSINESPLLAEVDDPLRTYGTNAVDSCLNRRRASFNDSLRSPPVTNISPPLTEAYGTPISQMSSLSSSISDPNVTIPNAEMGSPQETPVISDNSDNHSSGCQAPPIESVEDRIRRLTPERFLPLINQLLLSRSKGIDKASRSKIADALIQYDKDIYKRMGLTRFGEYASQAERASLVELNIQDGHPWIALHPRWFRGIRPQSPNPSVHSNGSSAPAVNVKTPASFTTTTPPPSSASQATPPRLNTPPPTAPPDKPIPFCFYPLVTCLVNVQKGGMKQPLRSHVGLVLGSTVYSIAGVSSLKEYLALAVDYEVVELGGANGHAWVRLHPDVSNGNRSF